MLFASAFGILPLTALSFAVGASAAANLTYTNVTVIAPGFNNTRQPSYPRTEQLPNGDLLAIWDTFSLDNATGSTLPIYKSKDNGQTWSSFSTVKSSRSDLQMHHPVIYALPEAVGAYPAGTVLVSVNAWNNNSTNIQIYASLNSGLTWEYVSTVAVGGRANTTNGATPVWEPFLLAKDGKLIAYYSDQRDPKHGQKLAHQTSKDLKTWGPVVNDVAQPKYNDRPGMTVVAGLPNNLWILAFEYAITTDGENYTYPIHYKVASDPEKFDEAKVQALIPTSGVEPGAAPYVVWTPAGGKNGTIVVSSTTLNSVFINQALGQGNWTEVQSPAPRAYSRSIRILKDYPQSLFLITGAQYNQSIATGVKATLMSLGL